MVVVPHPNSERVNSVIHVGSVGAMVSYRKQTFVNEEQVISIQGSVGFDISKKNWKLSGTSTSICHLEIRL